MYKIAFHKVDKSIRKALDKNTSKNMFSRDTQLTLHEADEFLDKLRLTNPKVSILQRQKDDEILAVTILIIDELEAKDYVMTLKVSRKKQQEILGLIYDDLDTEETQAEMDEDARERIIAGLLKQYQEEESRLRDSRWDMSEFAEIPTLEAAPDLSQTETVSIKNTVELGSPIEENGNGTDYSTKVWGTEDYRAAYQPGLLQPQTKIQTDTILEPEATIPYDEPTLCTEYSDVKFPDYIAYVHVPEGEVLFEQNKARWNPDNLLKYLEIPADGELLPLEEKKRAYALSVVTGPKFSALSAEFADAYNGLRTKSAEYLAGVYNNAVETDYQREAEWNETGALKKIDEKANADLMEYIRSIEDAHTVDRDMFDDAQNVKLDSYKQELAAERKEFMRIAMAKQNESITAYKVEVTRKTEQEKNAVILKGAENLRYNWKIRLADVRRKAITKMSSESQKAIDEQWQKTQAALDKIKAEIDNKVPQWEKELAEAERRELTKREEERRDEELRIKKQSAESDIARLDKTATEIADKCDQTISESKNVIEGLADNINTKFTELIAVTEKQQETARSRRGKIAARVTGILLSLVVIAGCCFGVYYFQNYRNGVETSINALQNQITEYQDTITSQKSNIETLESQLSSATEEISGYLGMVNTLEAHLDEAENRQAENAERISSYEQTLSEMRVEIGILKGVNNETGEN